MNLRLKDIEQGMFYLAQDRDWWRAFVNTVVNFGFNKML
jgi:hypothetical protein